MSADTEREMIKRLDDRKFFRWHRIIEAVYRDRTANLEVAMGLLFLCLHGILILWNFTTFPPEDVKFFLRAWQLTEERFGLALLFLGVSQILAVGTRSHDLRGVVATIAFIITSAVTTAYIMADIAPYFMAWVAFLAMSVCEFYLMVRNWRAKENVKDAQKMVINRIQRGRKNG